MNLKMLLAGQTYMELRTLADTNGEVRAQIKPGS
jgi:hypothetical protein